MKILAYPSMQSLYFKHPPLQDLLYSMRAYLYIYCILHAYLEGVGQGLF